MRGAHGEGERRASCGLVWQGLKLAEEEAATTKAEAGQQGCVGAGPDARPLTCRGYGTEYGIDESRAAFSAIVDAFGDKAFIDTAEVYGFGKSEEYLGQFMKETGVRPVVATKFAPQPWRQTADSVSGQLTRVTHGVLSSCCC